MALTSTPQPRLPAAHEHFVVIPTRLGFLAAGTLGVVATALLEVYLLPAAAGTFIGVAVIKELGKGAVLLAVAHQVHHREPRDGMVLGAVVGAGFAAFESAGYALQSMLNHIDERPLINILETEALRAVLAPFGHITWTALLGGALFASSRAGRFRLTARLGLTFLGVVVLHALWDQSYGWGVMISKGVTGTGWALMWPNSEFWAVEPSASQLIWFNVFYNGILGIVALVGLIWVIHEWRRPCLSRRRSCRWRAGCTAAASLRSAPTCRARAG
jgi:hypothetical protein